MDKSFAILIVCYKRLDGIKRLLKSLEKVDYCGREDITLIFSIDKSDEGSVERYASCYNWMYGEKRVLARKNHLGLKEHILKCGDLTKEYDILVVLEDDVFVSDSMYCYAYQSAVKYWNDDNIAGISLFGFQKNWLAWHLRFEPQRSIYDAYFMKIAQSWGQVWTYRKWRPFREWLEKNDTFPADQSVPEALYTWGESSWLKYHDRYCITNNKYFVYPYTSLSTNFSDAGEHSNGSTNDHQVELQISKKEFNFSDFKSDSAIVYDEYMNREGLGAILGLPESELTVDFWGTKEKSHYRRYLLTSRKLDYSIAKRFSLSLRPIELAIQYDLEGNGLWLYDTAISKKNNGEGYSSDALPSYGLRTSDFKVLIPLGIRSLLRDVLRKAKKAIIR